MAPNIALAQRRLIEDAIYVKLRGGNAPTDEDIAKIAASTTRTVRRNRSNLFRFGTTRAPSNGAGRPKTITPNMLTALRDQLVLNPCMRQRDMVAFLLKEFDVHVTRYSVSRALKSAGYTKKVTRTIAKERNPDLRAEHIYERSLLRSYQLVYIDESGCDKSIGIKNKGYAPKGVTPVQTKRFHRGQRFQILPAYTQEGVLHFRVFEGSTDSGIFESFIEELLPYCGKWPEPRSVLVMDNASIHHSERVQQLCDAAGVLLLYLPPYSPDLNPIEEYFGELKTYIREIWDEHGDCIKEDFGAFLKEAVSVVGERHTSAEGHFKHAGISIDELPII